MTDFRESLIEQCAEIAVGTNMADSIGLFACLLRAVLEASKRSTAAPEPPQFAALRTLLTVVLADVCWDDVSFDVLTERIQ